MRSSNAARGFLPSTQIVCSESDAFDTCGGVACIHLINLPVQISGGAEHS